MQSPSKDSLEEAKELLLVQVPLALERVLALLESEAAVVMLTLFLVFVVTKLMIWYDFVQIESIASSACG
jgi:hypothetical protein